MFRYPAAIGVDIPTFARSLGLFGFCLMQLTLSKPQLLADEGQDAGANESHGHDRLIFLML